MEEIKFALDTFYAVMAGALVMWMAAGFTMLEAGMIKKKNAAEIVTKNLGLYSIACIMYLICGFILITSCPKPRLSVKLSDPPVIYYFKIYLFK